MTNLRLLLVAGLALIGAACSGGGGGSVGPAPPLPITYANTSSPHYLPLAAGNQWKFASGGIIRDNGSGTLSCGGCPYDGGAIEGLDVTNPSGTYTGTFYFAKGTPFGSQDTFLVGVSTDHGSTITAIGSFVTGSGQTVPGIGVISDSPQVGETWSDGGGTSVIQSVGGTQSYGSNQQIKNIAVDVISGAGNGQTTTITWAFAQGVGFTSVAANGASGVLASFSISVTNSYSIGRRVFRLSTNNGSTTTTLHSILDSLTTTH